MPHTATPKALIFDFDGLILDTEMPDYISWQEVYQRHGAELPLEKWLSIVGGTAASNFDPHHYLETLTQKILDPEAIWVQRRKSYLKHLESQPILPGVIETLQAAAKMGLKTAVASSSPHSWVHGHLSRLGLLEHFEVICTADDVRKTKPDPELFLLAVEKLSIDTSEAVVFEDSINGVLAANRAGILVVAVPNPLTQSMDFSTADLCLKSLTDLPLASLLNTLFET